MKVDFQDGSLRFVSENSKSQFAVIECDICRSGTNSHRMNISRRAIRASVPSVVGKPILASVNFEGTNFEGHEIDEIPVGFFDEEVTTPIKDGELYLRARGKIWKRYFPDVMKVFQYKQGKTDVSAELEILQGEEPTERNGHIDLFSLTGCTLLGVRPAIPGSEARVLTFAEIKKEYAKESEKPSERRESMAITYKIDTKELKHTPWGDVDKIQLRDKIMEAENRDELVKEVYALVEDGWQEAPSEHLKYPIMELDGETFYYNREALASALGYAKKENEEEVIKKVEALYEKFELELADEGEPAVTDEEIKEEVVDGEGDDEKAEEFSIRVLADLIACKNAVERLAFIKKLECKDEDANIVMAKVCELCDKLADLEKFKQEILAEKTEAGIANILSEVKPVLAKDDYAKIEKEAKDIAYEDLDLFRAKTKAFAFDNAIEKVQKFEDESIIKMGLPSTGERSEASIFEKILNK